MIKRLALLPLIASSLVMAAGFQNGQAARVVIGQDSFSAHDSGISATALTLSNGQLYAASSDGHLFTFDLTKIPGAKDDLSARQGSTCPVCGFYPINVAAQAVFPGIAAVSVQGKTVVIADAPHHRVLIWLDASIPGKTSPDVILGTAPDTSTVSATTLSQPVSVAYDGTHLFVGDAALHRVLIWNSIPKADNQPADVVLGQPDFTSAKVEDFTGPDTFMQPSALASDGVNLYVADAVERRILVFSAADVPLAESAVVNSATLSTGPLAPGTLITIAGSSLTDSSETATDDGSKPLPKKLAGVEVFFNGLALPLLAASSTEIRAQLPYSFDNFVAANLYVRTEHADGSVTITNAVPVRLAPVSPGLFAFGGTEPRGALLVHSTITGSGEPGAPITSDNAARPGETVVVWAAGLGTVADGQRPEAGVPYQASDGQLMVSVSAWINDQPAQVLSAVLPQNAIGIYEIRILVPPNLPSNPKTQLYIMQGAYTSNMVTFPVRAADE